MKIDVTKSVDIIQTPRVEMLGSMFDVPTHEKLQVHIHGDLPLEGKDYNIGLIVGPSGSGKTILLQNLFNIPDILEWRSRSVIDDFPKHVSMEEISRVCQSVGFNTIPSWLRPFSVLSNGEQFRSEVARRLLTDGNPITIDEFTSVVDRQVAKFACHAIQKYVREKKKKLVVASCHYDIIDWLQPDWILEPGNPCHFSWRSLQRRPPITVGVSRIKYDTWELFRDFHYMSQDLNKAARCYGLFIRTEGYSKEIGRDSEIHKDGGSLRSSIGQGNISNGPGREANGEDARTNLSNDPPGKIGTDDPRCDVIQERSIQNFRFESNIPRSILREDKRGGGRKEIEETKGTRCDNENASRLVLQPVDRDIPSQTHQLQSNNGSGDSVWMARSREENAGVNNETYRIASMCGILYRPHPRVRDIYGVSRVVTLPDYQGIGLAFSLIDAVASAYKALGKRVHNYPNHPAYVRSYQRSGRWMQIKDSGSFSPRAGTSSTVGGFGGRKCAVFMYIGPAMNLEMAKQLVEG